MLVFDCAIKLLSLIIKSLAPVKMDMVAARCIDNENRRLLNSCQRGNTGHKLSNQGLSEKIRLTRWDGWTRVMGWDKNEDASQLWSTVTACTKCSVDVWMQPENLIVTVNVNLTTTQFYIGLEVASVVHCQIQRRAQRRAQRRHCSLSSQHLLQSRLTDSLQLSEVTSETSDHCYKRIDLTVCDVNAVAKQ